MDWSYTEEKRWKHRHSCTGVESTGEAEERTPNTELDENAHVRAEGEKHHVDGMQENGKEQDSVEGTNGRPPISNEINKEREREREREREALFCVSYALKRFI